MNNDTLRKFKNWSFVLDWMRSPAASKYSFDSYSFVGDDEACYCSVIFLSGFYGDNDWKSLSYPNNSGAFYHNKIIKDFDIFELEGYDIFEWLFDNDCVLSDDYGDLYERCSMLEAAQHLSTLLGQYGFVYQSNNFNNGDHITIHFKNGRKDIFQNEDAVKSFLKLNPSRTKSITKFTRMVEVISYKEEEIKID